MAGSLDELIRFLLDEIAISGRRGTTPAKVLGFISAFYKTANENAAPPADNSGQARRLDSPTIDRAFQEQVWRWLTKHPDVHVGKDRRGNKMSLSAVEAQHLARSVVRIPEAAVQTSSSRALPEASVQQQQKCWTDSQTPPANGGGALRVYVSEERTWPAICGHSKDLTKVYDMEFALLSVIAAHREVGILQGDLIKESGQDKRSVPKRTDALRDKGYIEKRPVHLKGLKTSRLVLRKFAFNNTNDLATPIPAFVGRRGIVLDQSLDFDVLIRKLFAILKEKQIITRNDLKQELEMTSAWQARFLARLVRKLEFIGCLKRVKAASEVSRQARYYFPCVKLIHEPSTRDMEVFHSSGLSVVGERAVEEPDLDDEDDPDQAVVRQVAGTKGNQLEEVDRTLPEWDPDRSLGNALYDLVHQAGIQGFTNSEIRSHIFGDFLRRPLEHLLTRLTTASLQSQPPHLQHLAIVRDTTLSGTIPLYVQYSFPNFEARVESGQAFWEAVKPYATDSQRKGKKKASNQTLVGSTSPMNNRFGFPTNYTPSSQYKGARATLGQALLAGQPEDLPCSNREPMVYQKRDGTYTVKYGKKETGPGLVRPAMQGSVVEPFGDNSPRSSSVIKQPPQPRLLGARPIGRPRKFLQGTEKFWQGQFAMARKLGNGNRNDLTGTKAGVMSDPAGLALFAKRPPQFDATLVRALQSGFPVPAEPKDVNQDWVDKILPILDRSVPGVHITPKGVRFRDLMKQKSASRVLLLRSARLRELNLTQKRMAPTVRFLTSSAAHTFSDLRNEFLGEIVNDSEEETSASPSNHIEAQGPVIDLGLSVVEKEGKPQGSVLQPPSIQGDNSLLVRHMTEEGMRITHTPERAQPLQRRKSANARNNERPSLPDTASDTQDIGSLELLKLHVTSPRSSGQPPPLTRRSSLKKKRSVEPARPPSKDDSEVRAAVTNDDGRDQVGTPFQDPIAAFLAGRLARNKTNLEMTTEPSPSAASDKDDIRDVGIGSKSSHIEVSENLKQAPHHPKSNLKTPRLRPTELKGAFLGATDRHTQSESSGIDVDGLDPANNSERDSEAFRLVQELTTNSQEQNGGTNEGPIEGHEQQRLPNNDSMQANRDDALPELRVLDVDTDQESPRKRSKQDGIGAGSIAVWRRKILLDIITACGGALPYYPQPLCNAFMAAWQKAGHSGRPDLRTVKAVVKSLCQNGKAKQIKFSHRNKKGLMVTKTILAISDMATSDRVILKAQKNMIEADPRPYIPQPLDLESELRRDAERQVPRHWPAVMDEETVETTVIPAKVLRMQLRETLSLARRRRCLSSQEAQNADRGPDNTSGTVEVAPRKRLGGIRRKYKTATEPYKKPTLSISHYHKPPQVPFSNQLREADGSLHFRTEVQQVPLTFQANDPQRDQASDLRVPVSTLRGAEASPTPQKSFMRTRLQAQQVLPQKIVWRNIGDAPVLPSSLEDVLLDDRRKRKPDFTRTTDPDYRSFEWNVDGVALWEQRSFNLFGFKSANWAFINHPVGAGFQAAPRGQPRITFDGLIWYDDSGNEHTEKRFHVSSEKKPGPLSSGSYSTFQVELERSVVQAQHDPVLEKTPRKRKRGSVEKLEATKKRRRGPSPQTHPQTIIDAVGNQIDVSHLIGAKYKRPRGTQHLRTMPEHLIYKLTITVVVVRALAGGLEKHVDWPFIMRVFPDEDERFLKDRWKTLSNKHRRDIDQLSENFQDQFPEAYANSRVPHINFDDLESVDWEGIVEWALENLDKPVMHIIPDLPATRSEFDETVNMKIEPPLRPFRDMLGYNQAVTIPTKEAAICAIPFSITLPTSSPPNPSHPPHLPDPTDDSTDPTLALAKSWALSTLTAPTHAYNLSKAQTKLQSLARTTKESEKLIATAMKSLTTTRAIARRRDKPPDSQGRTFDLSRIFTDTLEQRRTITANMLRQAARYKREILDIAFQRNEIVKFQPTAIEDGEMVALLNLAANDRIEIRIGDDVPRNRWGIDPESKYQTRNIRKESLYFTVLIVHVPGKYLFGNPLALNHDHGLRIPDLGTAERDMIPIWRDIHGNFQRKFWGLALAAVLGIVASRPGASGREVGKMMGPALGEWEVDCLLGWGLRAGAVRKTGVGEGEPGGAWTGGWEVEEWWWLVLDLDLEIDGGAERVDDGDSDDDVMMMETER